MDGINERTFSVVHSGPWSELDRREFRPPGFARGLFGKVFLKEALGLTAMELSLNKVPPGRQSPFLHRHVEHEELYLFVEGQGQMQVDGVIFDVREGTSVRVAPEGVRALRNSGPGDLYFVCVQAKAGSLAGGTIADGRKVEGPLVWTDPAGR
jgi:mannose-6-phosphate isomerase-like protein (cupin superfamily)